MRRELLNVKLTVVETGEVLEMAVLRILDDFAWGVDKKGSLHKFYEHEYML